MCSLEQEDGPPNPIEPGLAGNFLHHGEGLPALIPNREPDSLQELHPAFPVRYSLLNPRIAQSHPPEFVVAGLPEKVPQQAFDHVYGGRGRRRVGGEVRDGARAGAPRRSETAVEVLGDGELGRERVSAAGARDGGGGRDAVRVGAAGGGGGGDEGRERGEICC